MQLLHGARDTFNSVSPWANNWCAGKAQPAGASLVSQLLQTLVPSVLGLIENPLVLFPQLPPLLRSTTLLLPKQHAHRAPRSPSRIPRGQVSHASPDPPVSRPRSALAFCS